MVVELFMIVKTLRVSKLYLKARPTVGTIRIAFDGGSGVPWVSRGPAFLDSHATVMMLLRSNSIGLSHPS